MAQAFAHTIGNPVDSKPPPPRLGPEHFPKLICRAAAIAHPASRSYYPTIGSTAEPPHAKRDGPRLMSSQVKSSQDEVRTDLASLSSTHTLTPLISSRTTPHITFQCPHRRR